MANIYYKGIKSYSQAFKKTTKNKISLKKSFAWTFPKIIIVFGVLIFVIEFVLPQITYFSKESQQKTVYAKFQTPIQEEDYQIPKALLEIKKEPDFADNISEFNLSLASALIEKAIITPFVDGGDKNIYGEILKSSIAHYLGTPLPGENGISVLFAHSSFKWLFDQNNYQTIFSLLPDSNIGDKIYLRLNQKILVYKIYKTQVIKPGDLGAIIKSENNGEKKLALLTCVPPGQNTFRLIIFSSLVEN